MDFRFLLISTLLSVLHNSRAQQASPDCPLDTAYCRRDNGTDICSNNGDCVCGTCECKKRDNPAERYSGRYCECDNFNCDRSNNKLCGGHGRCDCRVCVCDVNYAGSACDCSLDYTTCLAKNGKICNGLGICECGVCRCYNPKFQGTTCEICPTCPGVCEEHKDCVQCRAFEAGEKNDTCQRDCSHFNLIKVKDRDELPQPTDQSFPLTHCKERDANNCSFYYTYAVRDYTTKEVFVVETLECPAGVLHDSRAQQASPDCPSYANCRKDNGTDICSNNGDCVCGTCECKKRDNPAEIYSGKYCECDNFNCDRSNNKLCGGHGRCECRVCICDVSYTGSACDCSLDQSTCLARNGQICNGRGTCDCGVCKCTNLKFQGTTCEICPTCPGVCTEHKDCVQCRAFEDGEKKDTCQRDCSYFNLIKVKDRDELPQPTDQSFPLSHCKERDANDCWFYYTYAVRADTTKEVFVVETLECPASVVHNSRAQRAAPDCSLDANCRKDNGTDICSNNGDCVCGTCECKKRDNPAEIYSGKYCECDNFNCERSNNKQCYGHGRCECRVCICDANYTGSACDCTLDQSTCLAKNGQICNGQGDCNCGVCKCTSPKFQGTTCEICPTCPGVCTLTKDCVQCLAFEAGEKKHTCQRDCSYFNLIKVKYRSELPQPYDLSFPLTHCKERDANDCWFYYTYAVRDDTTKEVFVVETLECQVTTAPGPDIFIGPTAPPSGENEKLLGTQFIIGLGGVVVLTGLSVLLIVELLRRRKHATAASQSVL